MSLVSSSNLGVSYGAQDVFFDVSFVIPREAKIALVGPNGSGKTTLLRLIGGQEAPNKGVVRRAQAIRIGYLPQQADRLLDDRSTLWEAMLEVFSHLLARSAELERLEAAMADSSPPDGVLEQYGRTLERFERDGGYTYHARIQQVLAGLGFSKGDTHAPIGQLSGGQKTRALLARLLLEEPDLLLLDEPTNHLDLDGVEWLENYLAAWPGAVVVVAHDRAFLDSFATQVWDLAWGRLEEYRGNYTAYVEQKEARVVRQQALYERQQEFITRTETFIRRNIAGQRTREAQGRRKRLDRLERIREPRRYRPMHFALDRADRSGDLVLGLYDLIVGYEPALPLVAAEEFELRRGETVALLGPNGCGKTSLVRTVLGEVPPLGGSVRIGASVQVGYLAQGHTNLDLDGSVLDTIVDAGDLRISEAREYLGPYRFSGNDVFKRVGDLSGGEQARVALAVLVLQGANFLILDEPTNHLDIPSQELFEQALADFDGTVLMVTHDRYLIRALAHRIWAIQEGQLQDFTSYGTYRDEQSNRRQRSASSKRNRGKDPGKSGRTGSRTGRGESRWEVEQRAARRAQLEAEIHELEDRQAELARELEVASQRQAVDRVRGLGEEYGEVERRLDELLADWTETA